MKRPSFQFYPADWRNNAKLGRCSFAARGAWMNVLCVLHDSDEYGVCRWPMQDLASSAYVPMKLLLELASKGVLKGSDHHTEPYVYTPRHAGKVGDPVVLVAADGGPCWFSSRLVTDEYLKSRRGASTRFSADNQPNAGQEKSASLPSEMTPPSGTPARRVGERHGDGPTASASSSASVSQNLTTLSDSEKRGSDPVNGSAKANGRHYLDEARTVLAFLNLKAGRRYREVDATLRPIVARLKSGVSVQDCKTVIARKSLEWGKDATMSRFLRPETLFGATKFEHYLAECRPIEMFQETTQ